MKIKLIYTLITTGLMFNAYGAEFDDFRGSYILNGRNCAGVRCHIRECAKSLISFYTDQKEEITFLDTRGDVDITPQKVEGSYNTSFVGSFHKKLKKDVVFYGNKDYGDIFESYYRFGRLYRTEKGFSVVLFFFKDTEYISSQMLEFKEGKLVMNIEEEDLIDDELTEMECTYQKAK